MHNKTHLPYRSWCRECVAGRSDNPAHRLVEDPDGERRRLPEAHLDYAFLRRESPDKLAKLLVIKLRPSRAARAYVAPAKGAGGWQGAAKHDAPDELELVYIDFSLLHSVAAATSAVMRAMVARSLKSCDFPRSVRLQQRSYCSVQPARAPYLQLDC